MTDEDALKAAWAMGRDAAAYAGYKVRPSLAQLDAWGGLWPPEDLATALDVPPAPDVAALVEAVEAYGFSCEAGPLTFCKHWLDLKDALTCRR